MFKNSSSFFRVIVHTVGVLFLIGILGSTALGEDDILSTVVQTIFEATFGPVSGTSSTEDSGTLPSPDGGDPGQVPPPPDTLQ